MVLIILVFAKYSTQWFLIIPRQRRLGLALTLCLFCFGAFQVPSASSFEVTSRVASELGGRIWVKDIDGAKEPVPVSPEENSTTRRPAISPYGDEVAWGRHGNVFVVGVNGRDTHAVYASPNYPTTGEINTSPHWHPDGQSLLISRSVGGSGNGFDLYTLGLKGEGLKPLITGPGDQMEGAYTSDGKKIVYSSTTAPNGTALGSKQLIVANADGTNKVQITTSSGQTGFSWAAAAEVSPDNSEVVFEGISSKKNSSQDIYAVQLNGLNLRRLTNDSTTDYEPEWLPSGQAIIFSHGGTPHPTYSVKPDGTERKLLVEGLGFGPKFRQPSTLIGAHERLAHQLRPELLFDSEGEHWRPQNVSSFFSNDPVEVCGATCEPVNSTNDLRLYPGSEYKINVPGSGDADNFKSALPGCVGSLVWDCGGAPHSSIYYHVSEPSPQQGYRYVDYWFFYRYNDAQGSIGFDHEADWEGVSIAPSSTRPETFDFASFSQHGTWYSYLRDNLKCDFGSSGSCGSEEAKYGRRLHAFIAAGTHANYGEPCGSFCTQTNTVTPETDHDGGTPWQRNGESVALRPFPALTPPGMTWSEGPAEWADWPGNWGMDTTVGSPANQSHFSTPWESDCADDDDCPTEESSLLSASSASTGNCSSWFGAGVAALACSPEDLKTALREQRLGNSGSHGVNLSHGQRGSASAPGVAQVMGSALHDGDSLNLPKGLPEDAKLFLRFQSEGTLYDAKLDPPKMPPGQVKLAITPRLARPEARLLLPNGGQLRLPPVARSFASAGT